MASNNTSRCLDQFELPSITDDTRITLLLIILTTTLSVLIVATNFCFILVMCRYRRKYSCRDHSKSLLIMMSLATCDALIGAVLLPQLAYVVVNNGYWSIQGEFCLMFLMLDKVLSTVSIYHIALMALDRYLAACRPLLYLKLQTKTVYFLILATWAFPIVSTSASLVTSLVYYDLYTSIQCMSVSHVCFEYFTGLVLLTEMLLDFWVPLLIIYTLYLLITRKIYAYERQFFVKFNALTQPLAKATTEALVHAKRFSKPAHSIEREVEINKAKILASAAMPSSRLLSDDIYKKGEDDGNRKDGDDVAPRHKDDAISVKWTEEEGRLSKGSFAHSDQERKLRRNSLKAYVTVGCIVVAFTVCWLPYNIFHIVVYLLKMELWPVVYICFTILSYANSAVNPICFCFTSIVRQAIAEEFC
ncbi:histamine H1 receptor-like [Biomphalaria glabrata]|uniref:Histamine H1 receptor-like n=1 Tax=Biomphalaria glabrata TaxID=6526 RepID=A0A9U8E3B1_BIOGL|nr:histamine H1 receptor-like [Biomphalaria glabrata]